MEIWEGSELVEGRRKSARILALKEVKKNKEISKSKDNVGRENSQTPVAAKPAASGAKRGRKRKKLEDVGLSSQQLQGPFHKSQLGNPSLLICRCMKDFEDRIHDVDAIKIKQLLSTPLSVKQVCEYILNTLQRRDTHDAFAQPVDPNKKTTICFLVSKVTTYYAIIKNPMDFGTVRDKLHAEMYATLQQFKRDVLLIPKNAIHFNAEATIYYQEAQGIKDLADELFRTLRCDRLRFLLKYYFHEILCPHGNGGDIHSKFLEPTGKPKFLEPTGKPWRLCGSSLRREKQADPNPGLRDGRDSNLAEAQRRYTYCTPSKENESLISAVYNAPNKSLVHIDAGLGYKESLVRFVKNLGPTAQMVAKKKLESLVAAQNCQPQATPPFQNQNYPAFALSASPALGHPIGVNSSQMTQMQHNSQYNLPKEVNVPYFLGDASAQGYAPVRASLCINEGAYNRNMNAPDTSRIDMKGNLIDPKGKAHEEGYTYKKAFPERIGIDINKIMDSPSLTNGIRLHKSKMEGRPHQNQNSNVQLESHIRVVRDLGGPETNSTKFRTVDMLAERNNVGNLQLLPQARMSRTALNQSRLQEIMSNTNTYLRTSSYLPSPTPEMSSLIQTTTSFNGFDAQLSSNYAANSFHAGQLPQKNNYIANPTQAGQLMPQFNSPNAAQGVQEMSSFPSMKLKLGEDHSALAKSDMFMRREQGVESLAVQGIVKPPPLYNAFGSHERASTQWYQKEPTPEHLLPWLVDSQQPNLSLQL
ncbi:hypothetical protein ACFX13_029730 [Malus domestica]